MLPQNVVDTDWMDVYSLELESGEETKITDFAALFDLPELNNTWDTPYFSFAPTGELYIRQGIQFYRWNPKITELTEMKLFPNDNVFDHFQLRSNDQIVVVKDNWIFHGSYNFSATYDIRIPQIASASLSRLFESVRIVVLSVLFAISCMLE
ncbi:hypothetical protein M3Y99_01554400 [Aphelenchoides fujianensis]|nr:hypothetical protein M3Y99_01554400 [Aphelenchoides fujianensis]